MSRLILSHCTLTGVDENTSIEDLVDLSEGFPFVEWGVLISPARQGQPGRYPSIEFAHELFGELPNHVRLAIHFCGQAVPDLINGSHSRLLQLLASRRGRAQLNFNQSKNPVDLVRLRALMYAHPQVTFITQDNESNVEVTRAFHGALNHAILFDSSGGRGIAPGRWPAALSEVPCGYAGGLGPNNVADEVDRIARAAGARPAWIDMETSLRTQDLLGNDWLSMERCLAVLKVVEAKCPRRLDLRDPDVDLHHRSARALRV